MNTEYQIYGIAYDCPVQKRNSDCPFMKVDSIPFKMKINWIKTLSRKDRLKIAAHHKACSKKRENCDE